MNKLLYFILMPLVYELLLQLVYFFRETYRYSNSSMHVEIGGLKVPSPLFHFVNGLLVDYALIGVYIFAIGKIVGSYMTEKDYVEVTGEFALFVICSGLFVFVHIILAILDLDDEGSSIIKNIVLVFVFLIFIAIALPATHSEMKNVDFQKEKYELVDTYTIDLHSLSDGHTTTGSINGGRYYIRGVIQDNYEIYYSFVNEKGSVVIRSITYSEEHVNIYEEENCEKPRIVFRKYYKEKNGYSSTYYDYDIYIPVDSMTSMNLDLE